MKLLDCVKISETKKLFVFDDCGVLKLCVNPDGILYELQKFNPCEVIPKIIKTKVIHNNLVKFQYQNESGEIIKKKALIIGETITII